MAEFITPDWISAFAAILGIPIVIWGIIKLFIKDRAQERKLNSLEKLAASQEELNNVMAEQILELSRQTEEFQHQSVLMNDANDILAKQLELQGAKFLHEIDAKEKERELQRLKRLQEIKPHFVHRLTSSNSSNLTMTVKNKGYTAKNLSLKVVRGEHMKFDRLNPDAEIEQGQSFELKATILPTGRHLDNGNRDYEIDLIFEDIDDNKYKQNINRGKFGKPDLIPSENPES